MECKEPKIAKQHSKKGWRAYYLISRLIQNSMVFAGHQ
jgi:hypothetical protein